MQLNTLRGGLAAAGFATFVLLTALGINSASAELVAKGVWSPDKTYSPDMIVTWNGTTYRSLVVNNKNKLPGSTNPDNATFWEELAVGLNPTGAWSSVTTYQPNDLAVYQGQSWRAQLTNTNVAPVAGANWELFAAKGSKGDTGATGPAGPTGQKKGINITGHVSLSGIANGRCTQVTFNASGAGVTDSVIVSTGATIQNGIVMHAARVASAGHIEVNVCNFSGTTMTAITNFPVRIITFPPS